MRPLGRREPPDFDHVEKYPLRALAAAPAKPTPVVMGTRWPAEFETPVLARDGSWWVGVGGLSGRSRGGHAYALEATKQRDSDANYRWHDQINEGICVSEGVVRAAALIFRRRFQPRPVYDLAQLRDPWPDTPPAEGTSVSAGFDVWRTVGLVPAKLREEHWERAAEVDPARQPDPAFRIRSNHWCLDGQEVLDALGIPHRGWVTILNSWNGAYPHRVRTAVENIDQLIKWNGEAGVPILG